MPGLPSCGTGDYTVKVRAVISYVTDTFGPWVEIPHKAEVATWWPPARSQVFGGHLVAAGWISLARSGGRGELDPRSGWPS